MSKQIIKDYKKIEVSFLSSINSIDEVRGGIKEPYDVTLEKRYFFGLIKKEIVKRIYLPKGFNHKKELIKGRDFA